MHYTLHRKLFTDEILNADIDEMILIYGKNFIRIYDKNMNVIAEKKYNTRVYRATWMNGYIVVLIELCRMEVLEISKHEHPLSGYSVCHGLKIVCLRYYEQPNLHTNKPVVYTPHDIHDPPCLVTPHAMFIKHKDYMLLRISRTHIALIMHESTVYNIIGTGLEGFTAFCFMPDFPLPTVLFVCNRIKLFTIQTMMKIDEFKMEDIINAFTLENGLCLQKSNSLLISHSKAYKNFHEVNIKGYCTVLGNDIFVCNENGFHRVRIFFMYGRVKECLVEKVLDVKYSWVAMSDNICILGSEDDDCRLYEMMDEKINEKMVDEKINVKMMDEKSVEEYKNISIKEDTECCAIDNTISTVPNKICEPENMEICDIYGAENPGKDSILSQRCEIYEDNIYPEANTDIKDQEICDIYGNDKFDNVYSKTNAGTEYKNIPKTDEIYDIYDNVQPDKYLIEEGKNGSKTNINNNQETCDIYNDDKLERKVKSTDDDGNFIELLYENAPLSRIQSKLHLKHKFTFHNYSIRSLTRYMNQLLCVGYGKFVILSDIVEMNLHFIMKIRGFDRFYKLGKIFCLTNQRESYFISTDNKEVDGYITDKETLEFVSNEKTNIQITKDGLFTFDKKCTQILQEINGIVIVKKQARFLYILDSKRCLWVLEGIVVCRKYFNVDIFCVEELLWIVSKTRLLGFKKGCVFDSILDRNDFIFSTLKPESLLIKDNEIHIIDSQEDVSCIYNEIEVISRHIFIRSNNKTFIFQYDEGCLKSVHIDIPPITFSGFVKLRDKLFIRPDILIYYAGEWNIQRISHRIVHISDKYILTRNTLSKYKFGPGFKTKYNLPNFHGEFIVCKDVIIIGGFVKEAFYQHSIRMFSCNLLKSDPSRHKVEDFVLDEFKYTEDEFITDLKFLKLNDNIRSERVARKYFSTYLITLSSYLQGFKDTTRGRIIVFEIVDIQTNELNKKTKKMRALADHKVSSNVMSCTEIRGNIAVCQGTRLMLYKFDRLDGLTAIAFHDMHLATTSISSVKNYIVAGDILRGVTLFFYQYKPVKMHKISVSDPITNLSHVTVLTFLSRQSNAEALFIAFDSKAVHLYTYSPNNVLSRNGEFLVKRGELSLNDHVIGSESDIFYSANSLYRVKRTLCTESEIKQLSLTNKKYSTEGSLRPITVKELLRIEDIRKMCNQVDFRIERYCDDIKWY